MNKKQKKNKSYRLTSCMILITDNDEKRNYIVINNVY